MVIALAVLLGLLPGFVWLIFYFEEDPKKPKKTLALTFLIGGLFVIPAIVLEELTGSLFGKLNISVYLPLPILLFAFYEELSKFFAAYVSVKRKTVFNQPIDAMFFMIIAALGFATVENIIALLGEVLSAPNYALSIQDVTQLAALRFIGATLVHALSSGIVGFYWAKSIERFFAKKYIVFGVILGVLIHALFNWMILYLSSIIYAIIILAIIGLFVLNDFEKLKRRAV